MYNLSWGFPGGTVVKNLTANAGDMVRSLGGEDPPEEETATYSSILAWEIPWTEEPGGVAWGPKNVRGLTERQTLLSN